MEPPAFDPSSAQPNSDQPRPGQPNPRQPNPHQHWQAAWQAARSFPELCALAARFLEGDLPFFPGWMAPDIDEETDALVPYLVAATRRGLLPTASQPGACPPLSHDGRPWKQRAFVVGFASADFEDWVRGRCAGTPLEVRSFGATKSGGEAVPCGVQGDREYLWIGTGQGPDELGIFADAVHPVALRDLRATRYLCLWDPEWGRDELLWPILGDPDSCTG